MASFSIIVNDLSLRTKTDLTNRMLETTDRNRVANEIANQILRYPSIASGEFTVSISASALAQASGTVTLASVQVGDTVSINGVALTAVSGTPAADQFDMSGSDTVDATSLASAINASTTTLIQGMVSATSSNAVVTILSVVKGLVGNAQTLASSNGGRLAVSGARLVGGNGGFSLTTVPTVITY